MDFGRLDPTHPSHPGNLAVDGIWRDIHIERALNNFSARAFNMQGVAFVRVLGFQAASFGDAFLSPLHAGNAAFIFVLPLMIYFCGRLFPGAVAQILGGGPITPR
jgi:hypothetical protein